MKFVRGKLTRRIWYDNVLWKLEKVISPTKYDDYLLLSIKSETQCHEDGTTPVEMILIDCHNNEFYPNTPEVKRIMESRIQKVEKESDKIHKQNVILGDSWMSCFEHVYPKNTKKEDSIKEVLCRE
jgi:hypothetical protein